MAPNRTFRGVSGSQKNVRMSGLFKMPNAPAAARHGLSRNAAGLRKNEFGPPQRVSAPKPINRGVEAGVGNTTRQNLMDMDDTLLNAVDLAGIEQLAATQGVSGAKRERHLSKTQRFRPPSPVANSPKRKKARGRSNFVVLDMCSPGINSTPLPAIEEVRPLSDRRAAVESVPNPSLIRPSAFSYPKEISPLTSSSGLWRLPNVSTQIQLPRESTPFRTPMPPTTIRSAFTVPVAGETTPVPDVSEPTVDLFAWESQAFDTQIKRIESGGFKEPSQPKPNISTAFSLDRVETADDDDDAIPCYQESNDDLFCSQLFLEQVDQLGKKPITRVGTPLNSNETFSIVKNSAICSQYIRMERSMLEENQANVEDDMVDSQLAKEFDPSQQRREFGQKFDAFERTIMDMTNIEPQSDHRPEHELADINWEEDVTIAGDRSEMVVGNKARLDSIFNKRQSLAATTVVDSPKRVARKSAPLVSSHFQDKGPFFGLPMTVKKLLRDFRGIQEMYDWQKECLALPAIVERNNLIYALPTSGGKTLVAEIIMFREILLRRRNVMFIVPYVSLAQEKLAALSPFAVAMEFLVEEYSGGKGVIPPRKRKRKNSVFVCTIEKALVLLDSLIEAERANEVGLVVIDELHMIGEERRGVNLEVLITKIIAIQAGIQIVGMSATIGNLNEIARFMSADIYCRDFRPVELKEYVKCGSDLLEINNKAHTLKEAFTSKQTVDFSYTEEQKRVDPDHVIALVVEVIPASSCLIFCPTKKQCEQLCSLLTDHLPPELLQYRTKEKEELINILRNEGSTSILLPGAFRVGIAYHHSGLTFDERKLIEDAFRMGIISLIICTSTLAAGVNLPAKRVIIRSPYVATTFLSLSRYKQMVGRAGRAGFGEHGDSILICCQKDILAVCNLLCSPMDEANSTLHVDEFVSLKNLILSAVGLGICSTRNDIQRFVSNTLLTVQAERLGVNVQKATDRAIATLYKDNAIKAKSDGCLRNPANMTIRFDAADNTQCEAPLTGANGIRDLTVARGAEGSSQEGKLVKTLNKNSRLEVNQLGKAAIRAGFHMEKAIKFYDELKRVGERLNVLDELHLLHVIVMEDSWEIRPLDSDYVGFFNQLSPEDIAIARRFHIGDFTVSRILGKRSVPADILPIVRRFYRVRIVYDLWNLLSPQQVAQKYKVDAGSVQTLMSNTAATASSLQRMCEELQELWAFRQLLATMVQRLSHCCTAELIPLMELPAVKIGRARQLYRAGFTSLASIAKAKSRDLVESVEHMSYRTANQLILSAKAKLMEAVEALKDEMDEYMVVLQDR